MLNEEEKKERKFIGEVGVDSGQILVTDPCYIDHLWAKKDYEPGSERTHEYSYSGACRETSSPERAGQLNYPLGHTGAGVAVSSGYGDGYYPVFATYNEEGRVAKVEIIFIGEEKPR